MGFTCEFGVYGICFVKQLVARVFNKSLVRISVPVKRILWVFRVRGRARG